MRKAWLGVALVAVAMTKNGISATDSFTNYSLPSAAGRAKVVGEKINYKTKRYTISGSSRLKAASAMSADDFMFAKQQFLAERRERAIKLLRQDLDAGFNKNRANMLLRLGQLYAEKYMELSYLENGVFSAQLKEFEAKGSKGKAPTLGNARSQSYLKKALGLFYSLERKYPKHPKMDEILYFIGFVEIEGGKGKKGSRYLERVVRNYPRSKKFDEAVLYLGDYYFGSHQFKTAAAKYSILLRRKDSSLHTYAKYKIAWCYLNTNQRRRALNLMKKVVAELEGESDKAKFNLRQQAIGDLVIFYGELGAVREAYAFYQKHTDQETALKNVRLIADILRSKAYDKEAIGAYELLLKEDPGNPESPLIQLGIYESLARMGKTSQSIKHLLSALKNYGATSDFAKDYPSEKKEELNGMLERLQSEGYKVALYHHSAAQKGTNRIHYEYAMALYGALVTSFPNHPERKKISFYQGEVLYAQKQWLAASEAYMRTSKIPPKDKMTDESVYNALLALDNLTSNRAKIDRLKDGGKEDLSPQEIPPGEQKFIEVATYYLKEYPKGARVVDVQFRIAAIYYHYRHLDKALEGFESIATKHPKHKGAVTSAHLVLDIYNLKKDFVNLDRMANLFASRKGFGGAKFRNEMLQIRDEVRFKKIETLEKTNKWSDAGKSYMEVYQKNPSGTLAQRSLYNALVSFEKANDTDNYGKATALYLKKYPNSKQAEQLNLKLANISEKSYDFDSARVRYEEFYRRYPRSKESRNALYNAAVFSEITEKNSKAIQLFDQYLKTGSVSDDERAAIYVSKANLYRKVRDWDEMNKMYRRLVYGTKSVPEKVNYLAALAHQYEKGRRVNDKNKVLKEILWFYRSVKGSGIEGLGRSYAAEAMFLSLDKRKSDYYSIRLKFPPNTLVSLMKRKQSKLSALAKSYDEVIDVGVPEWGVAALYEKGDAYQHYVKSYRDVKIPKSYNKAQMAEAEASLKQIDAEVVQPLEKISKDLLSKCVENIQKFSVASSYANKCVASADRKDLNEPSGLLPRPLYWSTRPLSKEIAEK